ncbi:MAG: hypothetical protein AUJ57_11200 [Zetaproteobacteria bacterium CG1_02_53_45]|nr:MAG: hypothetical protein AUJ57_11200 [Zetaproteobacteria bacterium CG1_02_53_45]
MIFSVRRSSATLLVCLSMLLISSCSAQQQGQSDDFTLQSVTGPVSLSDLRGQIVLLFFGYTHCPDVCPATMNNVASALRQLDTTDAKRVKVLFVTVDPERDSAEHLAKYLSFFNPDFIGLTGSPQAIKKTTAQYDVELFIEGDNKSDSYEVIHSSLLFLINGDGKIADVMSHHTEPDDIAIALRKWLNLLPLANAKSSD